MMSGRRNGDAENLRSPAARLDADCGDCRRFETDTDAEADVCIVGAGIAGIKTAYLLAQVGVR
jgi:NADPH-dependent 2,4-dienoyl-CoA reductase/sulfur reductase-like enzyme